VANRCATTRPSWSSTDCSPSFPRTGVRLIATTTTAKGLTVTRRLDRHRYPAGRKMSNDEIASVNLTPHAFHGELNYLIRPRISL
jgi:hypothetical protein